MQNSEITQASEKIGADLPTLEQYRNLFHYFLSPEGDIDDAARTDFTTLFPDCVNAVVWNKDVYGDACSENRLLNYRCVKN